MAYPFGDPLFYYGDPDLFVIWNQTHVMRCANILDSAPVWATIESGLSGTIRDVQIAIQSDGVTVAWALTSAGIFLCEDIKATSITWDLKLPVATVIAGDAVPDDGTVTIAAMAAHPTLDGYLICATRPAAGFAANANYPHAYTWHTHDLGATWHQDDMNGYLLLTSSGPDVYRGYVNTSVQACEIAEDGTIYLCRVAPVIGVGSNMRVFASTDLGDSWAQLDQLPSMLNNRENFSITAPDQFGTAYAVQGDVGVSSLPSLHLTTDSWTDSSEYATPSGYDGVRLAEYRVALLYGQPNAVRVVYRYGSDDHTHLRHSDDKGATWTTVWDFNPNSGGVSFDRPPYNWPSNPLLWVFTATRGPSTIANVVRVTLDDFATSPADKSNNLEALIGSWTQGLAGGFALPRPMLEITRYRVGIGGDLTIGETTELSPQPHTEGPKITRRDYAGAEDPNALDNAEYIDFDYSGLANAAMYQSILAQYGVDEESECIVTVWAKTKFYGWRLYRGVALQPQIKKTAQWSNYFPRNITIRVIALEPIE